MQQVAVVFVHGLFSSARTWGAFRYLVETDPDLAGLELFDFEYPSPKFRLNPLKRIPDFTTLADSLQTFLETLEHAQVILVSHSQGGLIVQRYLARMVMGARGHELARIRRVVMFACPNSGSEIFLTLRRSVPGWRHPQERQLRPLDEAVAETQRVVINRVIHAGKVASDQCPVPVRAYAGEEDNVVTPASARGVFPHTGVLPGDHFSIIRPDSASHRAYLTLKDNITAALRPPTTAANRRSQVRDYLYVSARKVGRIGRALHPEIWDRMENAPSPRSRFSSNRIAASTESRAEDVIALVPQVEALLEREHGLKDATDPELKAGQWFRLHDTPMIYGVPGRDIGGALFIGETSGVRFALGGSAEYLLDRPAQHLVGGPWGYSASGLRGIRDLLEHLAALDHKGDGGAGGEEDLLKRITERFHPYELEKSYASVVKGFGSGWEPLTAVARCLHTSSGVLIGTPLYVAFSVPA
ncbi:Alpha/beta hydrolase family protein [Thermomonospora echinospora]|uniref:Alpha/beta hydrolase family protein n=1 Tax=Thermomonospora echinospora TaxID=1992 RepID=A0A1H6DDE5_9ACTN|nr:SAVMC3_10250 family protein [Thermomonospora echinospora]SEG83477.1 Alpha/beta hydrolase family protein [Thermomonospora echinospora]